MQTIFTNIASINSQRNLAASQNMLQTSLQRLSSGLRINTAKDDAAGLAISERFTAQIRGVNQAARNAQDGISLSQTSEGSLGSIGNMLQRIRELAVQSANSTNSATDRQALNQEVAQLIGEVDRVATQTEFNGIKVLDGSFTAQQFQVGADAGQTITLSGIASARAASLGQRYAATVTSGALDGTTNVNLGALQINGTAIGSGSVAADAKTLSDAINAANISGVRAAVTGPTSAAAAAQTAAVATGTITINGVSTSSFSSTGVAATDRTLAVSAINAMSAATGVTATDTGSGVSLAAADGRNIALSYGTFTGANFGMAAANTYESTYSVSFSGSQGGQLAITGTVTNSGLTGATTNVALTGTALSNVNISDVTGANTALATVDAALATVNSQRASLGAFQNRFESAVANLRLSSENLQASRSRVLDADFAAETANLTRSQILQQAGIAMLTQANQIPQQVMSLLRG